MSVAATLCRVLLATIVCVSWSVDACAQWTGDPTLDNWLASYQQRGGNNQSPVNLQPSNYPIFNGCRSGNAPGWESNCPSDLTYTPLAGAGGYQAFGVAITNV